jgi:stress-induced-phosphoprotein 1
MNPQNLLANLFKGDMMEKAKKFPKTAAYLSQPDFVEKVKDIQKNPQNFQKHVEDPRIAELLTSILSEQTGVNPEEAAFEARQRQEEEQRRERLRREEEEKKQKEEEERKKKESRPEHLKLSESEKLLVSQLLFQE